MDNTSPVGPRGDASTPPVEQRPLAPEVTQYQPPSLVPPTPPSPNAPQSSSGLPLPLKLACIIVGVAVFGLLMAYTGVKIEQHRTKKAATPTIDASADKQKIIQQALVKNLQTKTVTRHITYRDDDDSSMLVTWNIASDFSNPRDPKTSGTLTIDYIRDKQQFQQQLEYVTVKQAKAPYQNDLYFRMVKGNEITNAPKDWFLLSSSDIYTLKEHEVFQRDSSVNLFGINKKATGFQNFTGFDFFLYNSPAFYIINTVSRDSSQTTKIESEITNNKAYELKNCDTGGTSVWCNGTFNTGGLQSISTNFATSEGLGNSPGLTNVAATQFWLTADAKTQRITKLEVGGDDDHKFVTIYSKYDQKVDITIPTTFIK